jgi:hypothetical protein
MRALGADVRYAARTLRKARGFAVVAVLTLGVGIAATVAVFTVVDAVLINVPFRNPEQLVTFTAFDPAHGLPWEISYAENSELEQGQPRSFAKESITEHRRYSIL